MHKACPKIFEFQTKSTFRLIICVAVAVVTIPFILIEGDAVVTVSFNIAGIDASAGTARIS